jgi:hypothetical protein
MNWDEIEALFTEGRSLSPPQRDALLAGAGADVASFVRQLWLDSDGAERAEFLANPLKAQDALTHRQGELVAGRFTLLQFLGAGGMGEVFSGRDETLGRLVALKFVRRELAVSPSSKSRLEREARALCALSHPGSARFTISSGMAESPCSSWNTSRAKRSPRECSRRTPCQP